MKQAMGALMTGGVDTELKEMVDQTIGRSSQKLASEILRTMVGIRVEDYDEQQFALQLGRPEG